MATKIYEGTAPGRLDVMGGIADYSGSLVLQMPIAASTHVSISLRNDNVCILQSEMDSEKPLLVEIDYTTFLKGGMVDYPYARIQFNELAKNSWIAYVIGCALVLQKEKGISFSGADIKITSAVPLGKGVSSSASLEVATMKALAKAFNLKFEGTELPVLAQRVENLLVGTPCGLMDQLASYFGEENKLLPIICQPDIILPALPIPQDISFVGIDSGVRHSVQGASYGDVRCAAFMGYTIVAAACGADKADIAQAVKTGNFSMLPYKGYLCNIQPEEFEKKYFSQLPASMSGRDFIARYGYSIDTVTKIDAGKDYAIFNCTKHPVYENQRVQLFKQHLTSLNHLHGDRENVIKAMGQLMFLSHESYSSCGLGSSRTDELIALAREHQDKGIAGAKITGGGSGGTVCFLAHGEQGNKAVKEIHTQFCKKHQQDLSIFIPL